MWHRRREPIRDALSIVFGGLWSPQAAQMRCARSALGLKSSKMGFSAPQARNFRGYGVYSYDFFWSIIVFSALHCLHRTLWGVGGSPPRNKKIKPSLHVSKKLVPYANFLKFQVGADDVRVDVQTRDYAVPTTGRRPRF